MSSISMSTKTEQLVAFWKTGRLDVIAMGNRVYLGYNENIRKLIVVMDAQFCDNTKTHWIVYFEWVNCMMSAIYFNKATQLFTHT